MGAFSLLISNGKLSKFAQTVASSGRLLAKNMLAAECIMGYARLLENALSFPSDALLPDPISHLEHGAWEWNLFRKEIEFRESDMPNIGKKESSLRQDSIVYAMEVVMTNLAHTTNISQDGTENLSQDVPNQLDWDVLREIESSEEYEILEKEEV